jgi:hypothetical protein
MPQLHEDLLSGFLKKAQSNVLPVLAKAIKAEG